MDTLMQWLGKIKDILAVPLFPIGQTQVTLWTLVYLLILVVLLFYVAGWIRYWLSERILTNTGLDLGARHAVGTITRYIVLIIGFVVIMQTAGINLTTLNVLAGAVGIGVGFGLQNIVGNFISGLVIMFERPIKVGDRIEVGDVSGDVMEIGARSTKVLTNDDITVIVPNSKFITENVVNWKYNDDKLRFKIPVGVAYGSDARLVEKVLLEVAKENVDVLSQPEPGVRFLGFGDSSLSFELRCWSRTLVTKPNKLISALNFAIYDKFAEHKIQIPFPQRDLHIRSGVLEVKSVSPPA